MARKRNVLAAILWIPAAVACASILDIQTAKVDPLLNQGDSGGGSLCERYCAAIQAACAPGTGFQQYTSTSVCLKICEQIEPGSESDDSGNTVGCRMNYAMSAQEGGELDFNCPAAGPGGNGICGTNCEGLCKVDLTTCTGSNATYSSQSECLSACEAVPDLAAPTDGGAPIVYNIAITSGFSVQCRLYHLGAAQPAPSDQANHCPHIDGQNGVCAP